MNAFRYSPSDDVIDQLVIDHTNDRTAIVVRDNGAGTAAELTHSVRVRTPRAGPDSPGSELGLQWRLISRQYTERW